MAKTFFPNASKTVYVNASKPHPEGTQYKISIGLEAWEGNNHQVIKVQMVYNGSISGRRSPSYPYGTKDFENVTKAIQSLL